MSIPEAPIQSISVAPPTAPLRPWSAPKLQILGGEGTTSGSYVFPIEKSDTTTPFGSQVIYLGPS